MLIKIIQYIDFKIVAFNVVSFGSIITWFTENATAAGFVLITIGILNLAKVYSIIKNGDKDKKK